MVCADVLTPEDPNVERACEQWRMKRGALLPARHAPPHAGVILSWQRDANGKKYISAVWPPG